MEMKTERFLLTLLLIAAAALIAVIGLNGADSSSADDQAGDVFTSDTIEGVTLTYYVIDSTRVGVGDGEDPMYLDASTITIPSSVTHKGTTYSVTVIRNYAFQYCSSLTTVNLPNTIAAIGEYAFEGTQLSSLTIPGSVTTILSGAFIGIPITTLTIPNSVTKIYSEAFAYCPNLTTVSFGTGFTIHSKGYGIFTGSPVTSMTVDSGHLALKSVHDANNDMDIIMNKAGTAICMFPSGFTGTYTTPSSVTTIGDGAFYGCSLTGIVTSANLRTIGDYAFCSCYYMTSWTYSGTNMSIGDYAFRETGLTQVDLGTNISSVGNGAFCYSDLTQVRINMNGMMGSGIFYECVYLTSVTIGRDVTGSGSALITAEMFRGCSSLETITVEGGNTSYAVLSNVLYNSGYSEILMGCPASSISSLTISSTVTYIHPFAFEGCTSLETVTVPSSVTSIGSYAFSGCTSLTTVSGCTGVTALGYGVFFRCFSLGSISLTNVDLTIYSSSGEKGLFESCYSLTSVTLPSGITEFHEYMFYSCESLTSITIPSSVTSIETGALSCTGLTSVSLPAGLQTLGDYAFYNCYSLASITIPNGISSIGDCTFYGCSSLTSVTLGTSVTSIGSYAFFQSGLTSFNADLRVKTVGEGAFKSCRDLESISLLGIRSIPSELFCGCSSLTSFTIGNDVTSIGYRAFYGCTSLGEIIFNADMCADLDGNEDAFKNTGKFTITFGDSVERIPDYLFYSIDQTSYTTVTSITIGDKVAYVRPHAFERCLELELLYFNSRVYWDDRSIADSLQYAGLNTEDGLIVYIGDNVTKIPNGLFEYTLDPDCAPAIRGLHIGSGITSMGTNAFAGNKYLSEIYYNAAACPDLDASKQIFKNCGKSVSNGCTVIFGASVSTIPLNLFCVADDSDAPKITEIRATGTHNLVFKQNIFSNITYLKTIDVREHSNVTFEYRSFYGFTGLNTLKVGVGTVLFNTGSFNCKYLKSIYIDATVCNVDQNAFSYAGTSSTGISVTFGDNVTSIPQNMFNVTNDSYIPKIKSITFGSSVASIGDNAFYHTIYLESVTVNSDNTNYTSDSGVLFSKDMKTLILYPSIRTGTSYEVPNGVTTLATDSFYKCMNLTTLKIPSSVTSTSGGAVKECTNLAYISIPSSITSLTGNDFTGLTFYDSNRTTVLSINDTRGYVFIKSSGKLVKNITITFDSNGGSAVEPIVAVAGTAITAPEAPTKMGYLFTKWQLNGADYTFSTMPSDNITLKAVWILRTYTVTLDRNDGTDDGSVTVTVSYNGKLPSFTALTRTGYTLKGYYTTATSNDKVIDVSGVLLPSIDGISDENGNWICDSDKTFYAQWTPNQYLVTFTPNLGGIPTPMTKTVTYDSAYGELATIGRTGYTFDGWFTAESGGTEVTPSTVCKTASNHNLYAHWTANHYLVEFNSNGGGTPSPTSKNVAYDSEYGTLATVSRTGYTFDGWFTEQSGGTKVVSTMKYTRTTDQTLYAHWTPNQYTVTFDSNTGDDPSKGSMTVTYDSPYGELATVTKTGHTFVGWFTSKTEGSEVTASTPCKIADKHTLYAHWTANQYTVTFDSNTGETPSKESMTVTYGSAYGELATTSKTGYTFDGWFTEQSGGSEVTASTPCKIADKHTLYAHWTPIQYTITYHGNGSTKGSMSVQTFTYDESQFLDGNQYERTGYKFDGWSTSEEGEVEYGDKEEVTNLTDEEENIDLYAHWTANKYVVSFEVDGGTPSPESKTVTYDSAYGELATVKKTGYTFDGWFTESTGGSKVTSDTICETADDHTLYAHWTANQYTVTFDPNTGDEPSKKSMTVTYDSAYGELATVKKTGYTFVGWFTSKTEGSEVTSITVCKVVTDHTLYAHWTPTQYTVTFDGNGAIPVPTSKTVTYDSAYGTLADVSRTGYTFDGWFTEKSEGTEVIASTICKTASDHTLYAHWTAIQYTVTFDPNTGGEPSPASKIVTYDSAYGELATVKKTGYTFIGWFTSKTEGSEVTSSTICKTTSDHTLYARWTASQYKVTFDGNGGTPSKVSMTVIYDSMYGTLANVSRTGYTFVGWYTEEIGGAEVTALTVCKTAEDHTLYAHWTANPYTVTFDSNTGGTPSKTSMKVTFGSAYGPLANVSKTGHTFVGWFTAESEGTKITSDTICNIASDHTLYAHWTPSQYKVTFNPNGGDTPFPASKTVTYEGAYGELATVKKTGYKFNGWYTEESGGSQVFSNTVCKVTMNHSLYAHWTPIQYTITYHGNGSTSGSMLVQTFTYDVSQCLYDNQYSRTGYTFAGWALSKGGEVFLDDNEEVKNLISSDGKNLDLYAVWDINQYTVTFTNEGKTHHMYSGDYGSTIVLPNNPKKESTVDTVFTFDRWDGYTDGMTIPAYDIEFTAKYTQSLREYKATYMNGNSVYRTYTVGYGKAIPVPENTPIKFEDENFRYEFAYWDGHSEGLTMNGNVTFHAVYLSVVKKVEVSNDKAVIPSSTEDVVRIDSSQLSDIKSKVESGDVSSLEIKLSEGSMTLDSGAIMSVTGDGILASIVQMTDHSILPPEIASKVEGRTVYSINLGDNHQFNGKLTITVAYTLKDGEDPNNLRITYYSSDGSVQEYQCEYQNGKVTFTTDHLSYYAVTVSEESVNSGIPIWMIVIIAVGAIIAATSAILILKKKGMFI